MNIVEVKFLDPATHNNWATREGVADSDSRVCYACGYLLEESDRAIKVALLSSDDREAWSDWIVLPKGIVLSVEVIRDDK